MLVSSEYVCSVCVCVCERERERERERELFFCRNTIDSASELILMYFTV